MRRCAPLVALGPCVLVASLALAAGPPTQPPAEVRKLIAQLGDGDLAVRKAAMKKLEGMGEEVIPTLRGVGRAHADVDVRLRAHVVAAAIEHKLYGELKRFTGHQGWVYRVVVAPSGLFAVSSGDALRVWDLDTGKQVRSFAAGNWAWGLGISGDNKRVIAGHNSDNSVGVYEVATGKEVQKLTGHTGQVWVALLSDDGKTAVTGALDRSVRVWDVETGRQLRSFAGVTDLPRCAAWSPDGKRVAIGHYNGNAPFLSAPGTVRIWDVETGKQVASGGGHTGAITAVSWSKDGKKIASSSFDKTVRLWDAKTAKELARLEVSDQPSDSVAFTPDGKRLVTAGWGTDLSAKVWDVATRRAVTRYDGHTGSVLCVAVTPDGKRVVTSSTDGSVRLWRLGK